MRDPITRFRGEYFFLSNFYQDLGKLLMEIRSEILSQ